MKRCLIFLELASLLVANVCAQPTAQDNSHFIANGESAVLNFQSGLIVGVAVHRAMRNLSEASNLSELLHCPDASITAATPWLAASTATAARSAGNWRRSDSRRRFLRLFQPRHVHPADQYQRREQSLV